jgi:membrane associated rhomboid family serine protease
VIYSWIVLLAAGSTVLRLRGSQVKLSLAKSPATLALTILVIVGAIAQWLHPQILIDFRRDSAAVHNGQYWRLISTLFEQDGGLAGTIFNIACLLILGVLAETVFGRGWMVLLFLAGGIATELVALSLQPVGAGNSAGNFALAGGLIAKSVLSSSDTQPRVLAILCILLALALVVMRDIHGAACLFGLLLGFAISRRTQAEISSSQP